MTSLTPVPAAPTPANIALMKARPRSPRLKVIPVPRKPNHVHIAVDHPDQALAEDAMLATFGTVDLAAVEWQLSQLLNATHAERDKPVDEATVNGALALMHGLAPRDAAEAMLCAQMVATHDAAMNSLRRARQERDPLARDGFASFATRLLRTYAAQMETLKHGRSGGQQRMTVEHVHVHPGAQAVVGNVQHGGGVGVADNFEERAHARQKAHGFEPALLEPALPGADEGRDRVPGAGGARETAL